LCGNGAKTYKMGTVTVNSGALSAVPQLTSMPWCARGHRERARLLCTLWRPWGRVGCGGRPAVRACMYPRAPRPPRRPLRGPTRTHRGARRALLRRWGDVNLAGTWAFWLTDKGGRPNTVPAGPAGVFNAYKDYAGSGTNNGYVYCCSPLKT
jgi:hypothetical protein